MKSIVKYSLVCGLLTCAASAFALQLVTDDEALASGIAVRMQEANAGPSDPMAPQITIVNPDLAEKILKNPFRMEVLFKSSEGTAVDFKSFQALYGTFKLDITSRLMKEAVKTASGIKLDNVTVPSGAHRILIRIRDSQNRLAEKEIYFKVE